MLPTDTNERGTTMARRQGAGQGNKTSRKVRPINKVKSGLKGMIEQVDGSKLEDEHKERFLNAISGVLKTVSSLESDLADPSFEPDPDSVLGKLIAHGKAVAKVDLFG